MTAAAAPEITTAHIKEAIRDVHDFPKPGIVFKDITPLLSDPRLFRYVIDTFTDICREHTPDRIVGIDARGFLFGAPVAYALGVGFVPVRKKGKLPYQTENFSYKLEYGEATVEMHIDAVAPGERVILVDDLLATGGTAAAAVHLVEKMGGQVLKALFVVELDFLNGRSNLKNLPINSLLNY